MLKPFAMLYLILDQGAWISEDSFFGFEIALLHLHFFHPKLWFTIFCPNIVSNWNIQQTEVDRLNRR